MYNPADNSCLHPTVTRSRVHARVVRMGCAGGVCGGGGAESEGLLLRVDARVISKVDITVKAMAPFGFVPK